jgi:septal ring factor EnvC (AmiA/AmiB activator)
VNPRAASWLAVLTLIVGIPSSDAGDRRSDLNAELRKLRQTQKELTDRRELAAEARRQEGSLLQELQRIDATLGLKKREVQSLAVTVDRVRAEVSALQSDIDRLERQRAIQQSALGNRLRTMYRIRAQGGALPFVLAVDDPVVRAIRVRQLATLAAVDARLIQGYRVVAEGLADRKAREETRRAQLEALRVSARGEQAAIDREAARRRSLLARVRDERAYHERLVSELTEARQRLEALIRSLQDKQRRAAKTPAAPREGGPPPATGFGTSRGALPWPTAGRLVAPYGAQVHPRFGTRTFRSGIAIEAGEGTGITAVYAGQVVYTGWFKGYGNLIILDHGYEYYTLYAHVAEIGVKEGERVRQGQRIGTVGDTGSLAGPRLHFEVRYQGRPQDPQQWLRQRG